MRISDWSSDVCSSDLEACLDERGEGGSATNGVGDRQPEPPAFRAEQRFGLAAAKACGVEADPAAADRGIGAAAEADRQFDHLFDRGQRETFQDRKSTRLNSSH